MLFSSLTQMSEIRKNMGVCPQYNVLYNELTVYEHLALFGKIKVCCVCCVVCAVLCVLCCVLCVVLCLGSNE